MPLGWKANDIIKNIKLQVLDSDKLEPENALMYIIIPCEAKYRNMGLHLRLRQKNLVRLIQNSK